MPLVPSSCNPAHPATKSSKCAISPEESAQYSKQMIESLQEIAERQGHKLLAQLLRLAADEASFILKEAA